MNDARWELAQVMAAAPSQRVFAAAQPLSVPNRWTMLGFDARLLWGRCHGSSAEPYSVVVDHVQPAWRCTCPSRAVPCKHVVGLLLTWVNGHVPAGKLPTRLRPLVGVLIPAEPGSSAGSSAAAGPAAGSAGERTLPGLEPELGGAPSTPQPPSSGRDERVARMRAGLVELTRWLEDRARTGLADPALASYATWDGLAARLVDAQVGALANRVRRIGGLVGSVPEWQRRVGEELGLLWLLAQGGLHLDTLEGDLADSVAVALGWQVRTTAVLAGAPVHDRWHVAGRSDRREDRIEVRRVWLRGERTARWAMVLSFAAYRQSLDSSMSVGDAFDGDLYLYPGRLGLRTIVGRRGDAIDPGNVRPVAGGVAAAVEAMGRMVAAEPWIEHVPAMLSGWVTRTRTGWVISDEDASLALRRGADALALFAASGGEPVTITVEWTPEGVIPLAVHLADRSVDLGPRADRSFVAAS